MLAVCLFTLAANGRSYVSRGLGIASLPVKVASSRIYNFVF